MDLLVFNQANNVSQATEVSFIVSEVSVKLRKMKMKPEMKWKSQTQTRTWFTENILPEWRDLWRAAWMLIREDVAGVQVTGSRRQVNDSRTEKTTTRWDERWQSKQTKNEQDSVEIVNSWKQAAQPDCPSWLILTDIPRTERDIWDIYNLRRENNLWVLMDRNSCCFRFLFWG